MKRLRSLLNPFRASGVALLGLAVIVASVAAWYIFIAVGTERVVDVKLSMGRKTVPPKHLTKFLLDKAPAFGVNFILVPTEGSEDALDKVESREVDVAVVKGGLILENRANVRQVTALDLELFHLLVKEPLAPAVEKSISALQGKRIGVNLPSTGTYQWSLDILKFAGLTSAATDSKGNFILDDKLGNPEMISQTMAIEKADGDHRTELIGKLPEAILLADPVPSPIVAGLVKHARYRLVPLDFGPAYIQDFRRSDHAKLDPASLIETPSIPAFSYGVAEPVPRNACATLGIRRIMIAHKDVPPQAIVRCLRLLYDQGPNTSFNLLDWSEVRPQYQPHDGVRMYDDERKRVLQNTITRLLERLASVLGGIIGGILAIYGYIRYRRLLRFEHYFHEIRSIELIARGLQTDPDVPATRPEMLAFLRDRLSDLRTSAIAEFARGRLQGESLILSIFTLIQDTGNYLGTQLAEKKA